eukprot:7922868-Alexandrium_andersonii.AAC.1
MVQHNAVIHRYRYHRAVIPMMKAVVMIGKADVGSGSVQRAFERPHSVRLLALCAGVMPRASQKLT